MKWLFRGFLLLLLLAMVAIGGVFYLGHTLLEPNPQGKKEVIFQVKPGMLGADVAAAMAEQGIVPDEFSFRMLLRFHPRGRDLRVGFFKLDSTQRPLDVLNQLLQAKPLTRQATFPEGLILPQIATVAKKNQLLTDERSFVKRAQTQGKTFGKIFPANLEGYLLPDTYEFPWDCDETKVLQRLTGEFEQRVLPIWEKKKAKSYLKDLHQVVVLASLVERESQVARERGVIAGVYINRLKIGMLLQCDATVQYARGEIKQYLTYADLEIDSPYNTYKYPGLPPGPIANPGMASLEAAMSPTPSKYLYYVRNDVKNDGSHVFGRNDAEHNENIRRYQR